jgi:hypothetical protein
MRGLLAPLNDPAEMARIHEWNRIVSKIAEQSGITKQEARQCLAAFEMASSSEGMEIH